MAYLINLLGVGSSLLFVCRHPSALANFINNLIDYNQQKEAPARLELRKKQRLQSSRSGQSDVEDQPLIFVQWPQHHPALVHTDPNKAEGMGLAQFYKYASNRENKIFTTLKKKSITFAILPRR